MSDATLPVPTYADVEAAAERLARVAHRTPVVTSATFLIDSESRLRVGGMSMPGMPGMDMGDMKDKDHSKMKH